MAISIHELAALVTTNLSGFNQGMDAAVTKLGSFAKAAQDMSAKASAALNAIGDATNKVIGTMGALGTAISSVAVSRFAEFEQVMASVGAVTQTLGTSDFPRLESAAREMGATTVFTATEAAQAMELMGQAGLTTNEIIEALPGALNLAAAGGISIAQAADLAAKNMRAWGMSAKELTEINDIMLMTTVKANTDLTQFGEAMKPVAPLAKTTGQSIREVSAILAKMSDAGFQGSIAGTALRNVIQDLLLPSKEAAGILDDLGISVKDSSGQLRSLVDIFNELEDAGADASQIMAVFGARGGPQLLAAMGQGTDSIRAFAKELENAGGTADRIAKAKLNTLRGQIDLLKSAIDEVMISLGKNLAPTVRRIVNAMTDWVSANKGIADQLANVAAETKAWFKELDPLHQKIIGISTAVLTIGPLLSTLTSTLAFLPGPLGAIAASLGTILNPFKLIAGLLVAITSPLGLVTAAVAAVGAAVLTATGNWERFKEFLAQLVNDPVATGVTLMTTFQGSIQGFITWFQGTALPVIQADWNQLLAAATQTWNAVSTVISDVVLTLWNVVLLPTLTTMGQFWQQHHTQILTVAIGTWNAVGQAVMTFGQIVVQSGIQIADAVNKMGQIVGGTLQVFADAFKVTGQVIFETFINPFVPAMERIGEIVGNVVGVIKSLLTLDLIGAIGQVGEFSKNTMLLISDLVKGFVDLFKGIIGKIGPIALEIAGALIEGLINGLKAGWRKVDEFFTNAWTKIKDTFNPFAKGSPSMVDYWQMGFSDMAAAGKAFTSYLSGTMKTARKETAMSAEEAEAYSLFMRKAIADGMSLEQAERKWARSRMTWAQKVFKANPINDLANQFTGFTKRFVAESADLVKGLAEGFTATTKMFVSESAKDVYRFAAESSKPIAQAAANTARGLSSGFRDLNHQVVEFSGVAREAAGLMRSMNFDFGAGVNLSHDLSFMAEKLVLKNKLGFEASLSTEYLSDIRPPGLGVGGGIQNQTNNVVYPNVRSSSASVEELARRITELENAKRSVFR